MSKQVESTSREQVGPTSPELLFVFSEQSFSLESQSQWLRECRCTSWWTQSEEKGRMMCPAHFLCFQQHLSVLLNSPSEDKVEASVLDATLASRCPLPQLGNLFISVLLSSQELVSSSVFSLVHLSILSVVLTHISLSLVLRLYKTLPRRSPTLNLSLAEVTVNPNLSFAPVQPLTPPHACPVSPLPLL